MKTKIKEKTKFTFLRRKRTKYKPVENSIREKLILLVVEDKMQLKEAAESLNLNYSTAKTIIRVWKKEDRFIKKKKKKNFKQIKKTKLIIKSENRKKNIFQITNGKISLSPPNEDKDKNKSEIKDIKEINKIKEIQKIKEISEENKDLIKNQQNIKKDLTRKCLENLNLDKNEENYSHSSLMIENKNYHTVNLCKDEELNLKIKKIIDDVLRNKLDDISNINKKKELQETKTTDNTLISNLLLQKLLIEILNLQTSIDQINNSLIQNNNYLTYLISLFFPV